MNGQPRGESMILLEGDDAWLPIDALHAFGVHLLAFDARHHGLSDRDGHASMLKFSQDVRAAVDFVAGRPDVDRDRIAEIVAAGGQVDSFGVGTRMVTSADAPSAPSVYYSVDGVGWASMAWALGRLNDGAGASAANPAGYNPGMWLLSCLSFLGVFFAWMLWRHERAHPVR